MSKKRLIALVVCLVMVLTSLAACTPAGGQQTTAATTTAAKTTAATTKAAATTTTAAAPQGDGEMVDGYYKYYETVDIDAVVRYPAEFVKTDPTDLWIYHFARDKMNINFNVEAVPNEAQVERTTLIFASNDLPDCLMNWNHLNPPATRSIYGDEEGQLMRLDELFNEELAPNISLIKAEFPDFNKYMQTVAGNIYSFPLVLQSDPLSLNPEFQPLWYYKPWYDAIGYETPPATVEEFLDALRRIKEQDPGSVGENLTPMGCTQGIYNSHSFIYNAFGFIAGNSNTLVGTRVGEDGLQFLPLHDAFYDYLVFMNTMYTEGLIEQDLYTLDTAQTNARVSRGDYGVFAHWNMHVLTTNWPDWVVMEPLTSAWNSKQTIASTAAPVASNYYMFITSSCTEDRAEALVRFMDVGYSKEKGYLYFHGPQTGVDDTYGMVSGWTYNDSMEKVYGDVTAGKMDMVSYRYSTVCFSASGNVFDRRTDGSEVNFWKNDDPVGYTNLQLVNRYNPFRVSRTFLPLLTLEDNQKIKDLDTPITDYIKAEPAKFITGARPLNAEEFEKFRAELVKLGANEYLNLYVEAGKN